MGEQEDAGGEDAGGEGAGGRAQTEETAGIEDATPSLPAA